MIKAILKTGMRVAEIGVWKGEFAQVLLSTGPAELVLIDPWEGMVPSGDSDGNNVTVANLPEEYERIKKWENEVVKVEKGYSHHVLLRYPDNHFDAAYIDGDHSFGGCYRDLNLAYEKVKAGGWIMGHDYGMNYVKAKNRYDFGVEKAVDIFCIRKGLKVVALGLDGCVSFAIHVASK
jgi:hypothetical protein